MTLAKEIRNRVLGLKAGTVVTLVDFGLPVEQGGIGVRLAFLRGTGGRQELLYTIFPHICSNKSRKWVA